MSAKYENRRRCVYCREYFPLCDLKNHPVHSLICKQCYKKLKK